MAVQPALRVIQQSPAQLEAVDLQLQNMQALATEARELRAISPVPAAQAAQALQAAVNTVTENGELGRMFAAAKVNWRKP